MEENERERNKKKPHVILLQGEASIVSSPRIRFKFLLI